MKLGDEETYETWRQRNPMTEAEALELVKRVEDADAKRFGDVFEYYAGRMLVGHIEDRSVLRKYWNRKLSEEVRMRTYARLHAEESE